jgi:hypothetical protein
MPTAAVEWEFAFLVALARQIRLNARWDETSFKGGKEHEESDCNLYGSRVEHRGIRRQWHPGAE